MSIAQIQFMAIDNTHTKYLKGVDKKAWSGYKDAYKAQKSLEGFMGAFTLPEDVEFNSDGEYDIPIKKNKDKKK